MIYSYLINKTAKAVSLVLVFLSVLLSCNKDQADTTLNEVATSVAIDYENSDALFNQFYKANGALEVIREFIKQKSLNSIANGFHVLKESGNQKLYKQNLRAFNEQMEGYVSLGLEGKSDFWLLTDKQAAEELIAPPLPRKKSLSAKSKYKLELVEEIDFEQEEANRAFLNQTYHTPYPSSDTRFLVGEDRALEQLQIPKVSQRSSEARAGLRSLMTILYTKTGGKGFSGHMSMIYDDNGNNGKVVLDANIRKDIGQDGMKEHSISKWTKRYPIAASMGVSQYSYKYEVFLEVDGLYNTRPKYSILSWRAKKTRRPNYVYCSLVPWIGYKYGIGLDIDNDRGPYVWPVDVHRFFDSNN